MLGLEGGSGSSKPFVKKDSGLVQNSKKHKGQCCYLEHVLIRGQAVAFSSFCGTT